MNDPNCIPVEIFKKQKIILRLDLKKTFPDQPTLLFHLKMSDSKSTFFKVQPNEFKRLQKNSRLSRFFYDLRTWALGNPYV